MSRLGLIVLSLGVLAGCGDDPECVIDTDCPDLFDRCEDRRCVPRGARDAGPDGSVDAGPRDAGADAGLDGGADAGPSERRRGTVVARQTPTPSDPGSSAHALSASFRIDPGDDDGSDCTFMTMDGCDISDCFVPAPPADAGVPVDAGAEPDAGVVEAPHAGTIVFDGDAMDLVLSPGADGTYATTTGTGLLWSAGGTVSIMATGSTVPTFSQSFTGPSQASITAPSFMTSPLMIDRAGALTLTWAEGATGTIEARITHSESTAEGTRSVAVACGFDPAAGASGTIPSAVLERIPTGPGGSLAVRSIATALVEPGDDWQVTVELRSVALADTGGPANISITVVDSTP